MVRDKPPVRNHPVNLRLGGPTHRLHLALLQGEGVQVDVHDQGVDVVKAAAKDGFTSYTVNFPQAKAGSFINSLVFEVEAAKAEDFEQQHEIIDFHLKRPSPKARFTDVPARRWTKKENVYSTDAPLKSSDCIDDIFAYARAEGAGDTIAALPGKYELRAQLEKEKDGGFTVEYVKENEINCSLIFEYDEEKHNWEGK